MIIDTKEYLAHHGIAGQKWGVRRYQNEDGSLTPEGYIHYGYKNERGEITKEGAEKFYKDAQKNLQTKFTSFGKRARGRVYFDDRSIEETEKHFKSTVSNVNKRLADDYKETGGKNRTKILSDYMKSKAGKEAIRGKETVDEIVNRPSKSVTVSKIAGGLIGLLAAGVPSKMVEGSFKEQSQYDKDSEIRRIVRGK